jgi:hypothetical protein
VKLTPEKRDKIDTALTSKGFEKINNKDHYRYILVVEGRVTDIRTKMSRGSGYKTVGNNLLVQMSKQLRMNNVAEFKRYIECTYSYNSYLKVLKNAGQV